jgi:diadenosine tetraphosphatase ApaH/serine/threonine PP2A family protein phosphatase
MMNWINGHTDRFRCLVCHAGIFSLRSLYYVTEELWFPGTMSSSYPFPHESFGFIHSLSAHVITFKNGNSDCRTSTLTNTMSGVQIHS